MRIVAVAAVALAALALAERPVGAQSLAEAAAKEKERRKAAQGQAKVYTENDLGKGKANGPASEGDSAAPAADAAAKDAAAPAGPGAKKEKSADEVKAEQQKAWRDKVQQTNDNIAKLSARIEQLQLAVNDISQNLYSASRAGQLAELEQTQKQLADARQGLADLEDQGRKNGYR